MENLGIECVFATRLDRNKLRPIITHQYPKAYFKLNSFSPELSETGLAQWILPQDLQMYDEDWNYTILQPAWKKSQQKGDIEAFISTTAGSTSDDAEDLSQVPGNLSFTPDGISISVALDGGRNRKLYISWKFVAAFDRLKECSYEVSTGSRETYRFEFATVDHEEAFLQQIDILKEIMFYRSPKKPLRYALSLCHRLYGEDGTPERRAITIVSKYPHVQAFKPFIEVALKEFKFEVDDKILEKLYLALELADVAKLLRLSANEKIIMRSLQKIYPRPVKNVTQDGSNFVWETSVSFNGQTIPLKLPIDAFSSEISNVNITKFIETFERDSTTEYSNVMVILHAIISQRKVLLIGEHKGAEEIASFVFSACSMIAPIESVVSRAFPYISAENMAELLKSVGFIAGCSNAAFAASNIPWDICCDIETGKVTLNSFLKSSSPYISIGDEADEKELIAYDRKFIESVKALVGSKTNEMLIRARFHSYTSNFVRSSLFLAFKRIQEKIDGDFSIVPSPLCVFSEEEEKLLSIIFYQRFSLWQNTWCFELLNQQWKENFKQTTEYLRELLNELSLDPEQIDEFTSNLAQVFDVRTIITVLRSSLKLKKEQILAIYQFLYLMTEKEAQMNEIIAVLLTEESCIDAICMGLLHNSKDVRYACMEFLEVLRLHSAGDRLFASPSSINVFFSSAIQRVTVEFNQVHTKNLNQQQIITNQEQWKTELMGSQESLASHGSRPSYVSFGEPSPESLPTSPVLNQQNQYRTYLKNHCYLQHIQKLAALVDPVGSVVESEIETAPAKAESKQTLFFRNIMKSQSSNVAEVNTSTNSLLKTSKSVFMTSNSLNRKQGSAK